jgi:hypothetical protein
MRQIPILFLVFLAAFFHAHTSATSARSLQVESSSPSQPPAIVIGFTGGFVKHDDLVHSEAQLAANLRAIYHSGVHIEVFENHHANGAYRRILQLLDTSRTGELTPEEKRNARIILYGHSWGGSETVALARKLEKEGIPVLLTIQIDSVSKLGQNDEVIPANVAKAVNFYQPNGHPHGRSEIRALDPSRTKIIGNFRFDYEAHPVHCYAAYPWWDRYFSKPHTEIECDPQVWNRVESLIRENLPAPSSRS